MVIGSGVSFFEFLESVPRSFFEGLPRAASWNLLGMGTNPAAEGGGGWKGRVLRGCGPSCCPCHPTSWKGNSANYFALHEFCELRGDGVLRSSLWVKLLLDHRLCWLRSGYGVRVPMHNLPGARGHRGPSHHSAPSGIYPGITHLGDARAYSPQHTSAIVTSWGKDDAS